MLYAVLRYVDGVQPRQFRWLLLLSGATLLGLASKEVAFMYIAIFGAFLTLYWIFQVIAAVQRGEVKPIAWTVIGTVIGLGVVGAIAFLVGGAVGNALNLPRIIFQVILAVALLLIGFVLLRPINRVVALIGDRAHSAFQVVTLGTVLGIFASLAAITFLNIIPAKDIMANDPNSGALLANLIAWFAVLLAVCIISVVGTSLIGFRGQRRLPWLEIGAILLVGLAVASILLFAEERSKFSAPTERQIVNSAIIVTWVICVAASLGLLYLRFFTRFFQEMRAFPVFDVLVVMGTLVLPWVTALPLWLAGYKLDENYASPDLIQAGILTAIPICTVAIIGGLAWNARVWAACAVTFYGIFAFFYTTIFTNPVGIVSGAIGSLGYWLEQQGVRRGGQPQYYYLLVQLPIYEFLPVIGTLCAAIGGLLGFWKFRAARYEAARQSDAFLTEPVEAESQEAADAIYEERRLAARQVRWDAEALVRFPMIGFMAFWTGMITYSLTLSGEKMPWLTMHIAVPLVFVTGWFLGRILDKVDWPAFFKQSWWLIVLTPIFIIAASNLIGPFLFNQSPFGLNREQLLTFGTWLLALMVTGGTLYVIWRVFRRVGLRETARVAFLGVFVLLAILTARVAWRFAYIDYDYATEFGVYAHGAPAYKTVMNRIEELSKATTDGMTLKVAYDNDVSWPGSWYFRNYTNARFLGDASGATDLDQMAAILVSSGHRGTVEPQLGDNFYRFDYIRMWWPMQDYFDLNANRVNNVLMPVTNGVDPAALRNGLWEIWWNRDYKQYGLATSKNFDTNQWPVADRMVFFVRKDIAAQIWDLGVGNVSPVATTADPFSKLRCTQCVAQGVVASVGADANQVNNPHGIEIGPNGNLYVADTRNGRINILSADGEARAVIGSPSTNDQNSIAANGTLREPWSVAVAKDGTIFVADTWNHRVQVFDATGKFLRGWGHFEQVASNQPGSPDGFWGPRDITLDSIGNVYVADTGNKRIRVYDQNGTLIRSIGSAGAGPGLLNEPVGVAIDNNAGRLYVADTWNKRIQVFTLDGSPITSWKVPNWYGASEDTGNRPYLALDTTGTRLFVTEPDTGRILVWDISNLTQAGGQQPVIVIGSKGNPDLNHFQALGGLTVNATTLFVADAGSNRILAFALDTLPGVKPIQPIVPPPASPQPTLVATLPATQDSAVQPSAAATMPATDQAQGPAPMAATPNVSR
jgi:DNA-binding beta-propeller fold protein YncE